MLLLKATVLRMDAYDNCGNNFKNGSIASALSSLSFLQIESFKWAFAGVKWTWENKWHSTRFMHTQYIRCHQGGPNRTIPRDTLQSLGKLIVDCARPYPSLQTYVTVLITFSVQFVFNLWNNWLSLQLCCATFDCDLLPPFVTLKKGEILHGFAPLKQHCVIHVEISSLTRDCWICLKFFPQTDNYDKRWDKPKYSKTKPHKPFSKRTFRFGNITNSM